MTGMQATQRPYWLSGEELCTHCLHTYAYAVESRCNDCDEPVCPHCLVVIDAHDEVLCPICHAFHAKEGV